MFITILTTRSYSHLRRGNVNNSGTFGFPYWVCVREREETQADPCLSLAHGVVFLVWSVFVHMCSWTAIMSQHCECVCDLGIPFLYFHGFCFPKWFGIVLTTVTYNRENEIPGNENKTKQANAKFKNSSGFCVQTWALNLLEANVRVKLSQLPEVHYLMITLSLLILNQSVNRAALYIR